MVQFKYPRLVHPLLSFTFGVHFECPFPSMHEKRCAACGLLKKWKFILQK